METLKLTIENHIAHVIINRPEKTNALNQTAWDEITEVFEYLDENPEVRVVVLEGGESKHFCAGIDLSLLMSVSQTNIACDARRRERVRKDILQLQGLIGDGLVREMAYTGRSVDGKEAVKIGIVNRSFADKNTMMEEVMKIATTIASKSPLSIRGTKHILLHTRDHSVADGLNYMATWNAAMMLSNDLQEAFAAKMQKRDANFES